MNITAPFTADPLTLGFITGTSPDKWARRWREARYPRKLETVAVAAEFFTPTQESQLLADGGVLLTRATAVPHHTLGEVNSVKLYDEAVALLAPKNTDMADLLPAVDCEYLQLLTLLEHPWHSRHQAIPAATPWQDSSWIPTDSAKLAELVASGSGAAILPLPLARATAQRGKHLVIPITCHGQEITDSAIWTIWLKKHDCPEIQDLIGVMRGRRSGSMRAAATAVQEQAKPNKKQPVRQAHPKKSAPAPKRGARKNKVKRRGH